LTYSPAYGAPELYDGQETSATDQYSLAISYVELRTGRLPFASETPTAVMKAKITGDLDLSRLPEREKSVIERATALEPAERFRSCREMVKALLRAVESVPAAEDEIVPGFKLVREIGAGAYGTVWEGRAPGEIPVAIKILEMEESAGRLEFRGLQAIKTINHPNLCPIFGIWLKDEFGRILEQSEGAAFTLETIGDVPSAVISDDHASPGGTDRLGHSDTDAERVPGGSGTPVGGTLQAAHTQFAARE
jgi:serine/threonine protein kinase